jgi:hypothetical protein
VLNSLDSGLGWSISVAIYIRLGGIAALLWLRRSRFEALLEVGDDVVDVFRADRYPDEVFCYTTAKTLLFAELLVGGCPVRSLVCQNSHQFLP